MNTMKEMIAHFEDMKLERNYTYPLAGAPQTRQGISLVVDSTVCRTPKKLKSNRSWPAVEQLIRIELISIS